MNTKLNNKGMSLVELLIAMAIASIVSLLIIVMMTEGTSMFRNESTKIDLQNEIQVVKNHVTDTFMEAKAINVVQCGEDVRVYTGPVDTATNALVAEAGGTGYTDSILTYKDKKLYITGTYMENIPDGYLLSENVLDFDVYISSSANAEVAVVLNPDGSHSVKTNYFYEGPISVMVIMKIGTEDDNKEIKMTIKIRNDIDEYNTYKVDSLDKKLNTVTPTKLDIR